jgi:glycolate oxidase iron-sulfur subunit
MAETRASTVPTTPGLTVATPTSTAGGYAALDPCVHCGFCLPACPTYLATGDESDSPRGRIVLMRALERGEIPADDPALAEHLDACLGCRGCEPACPSGVGYGRGLEAAREQMAQARGIDVRTRGMLAVFSSGLLSRVAFGLGKVARTLGLADRFAGADRTGFTAGMLQATTPTPQLPRPTGAAARYTGDGRRGTVALFRGCVMDVLFDHVHAATRRVLEANGWRVVEATGQGCCGALHEHAGDRPGAERLARANVAALAGRADHVAVNSAGCGALLKDYGHLLHAAPSDPAARLAGTVRDVSELLAGAELRIGGRLELDVAYDPPCHLQHAQRVHAQPLAMLRSIPGLRLQLLPDHDKCCGSAGIYSMLHPELARSVLDAKVATFTEATPRPTLVVTGNPGCLMQIGAGLRAAGLPMAVAHPIELLDASYAVGGVYG